MQIGRVPAPPGRFYPAGDRDREGHRLRGMNESIMTQEEDSTADSFQSAKPSLTEIPWPTPVTTAVATSWPPYLLWRSESHAFILPGQSLMAALSKKLHLVASADGNAVADLMGPPPSESLPFNPGPYGPGDRRVAQLVRAHD